jgi:type III pantothenate kinase
MFLAIDIGNTNITFGAYRANQLGPRWRFATDHGRTSDEYGASMLDSLKAAGAAIKDIRGIAIASVVPPLTEMFVVACGEYLGCNPLVVDSFAHTGIRSCYDDPRQVGADRIVDVAAAFKLYGGPAVVIDFGTATTFDAITSNGDYLGGAIAPGIGIAAEALSQRASKLPKVDMHRPPAAIGRNLTQSLQSGLLLGYVGLVEGMIKRFCAELGPDTKVIATGGLAAIIAKETPLITTLAPWLTLDGLRIIYDLNRSSGYNPE